MFQAYKNFIIHTYEQLTNPHSYSFSGYIEIVLKSMLIIISLILLATIVTGIIALPFFVYKKYIKRIYQQLYDLEGSFFRLEPNERTPEIEQNFNLQMKKLKKKKNVYIGLFILLIIVIYIPMILPLIFMLIDFLNVLNIDMLLIFFLILLFIELILLFKEFISTIFY